MLDCVSYIRMNGREVWFTNDEPKPKPVFDRVVTIKSGKYLGREPSRSLGKIVSVPEHIARCRRA